MSDDEGVYETLTGRELVDELEDALRDEDLAHQFHVQRLLALLRQRV